MSSTGPYLFLRTALVILLLELVGAIRRVRQRQLPIGGTCKKVAANPAVATDP